MTVDVRTLKIAYDLSCSMQAARVEYEVARSQLALDYHATRRKLVDEAKAYAASIGVDPSSIVTHDQDSTQTMVGVR